MREKFGPVMEGLASRARAGDFLAAAKAIMTTDTFPKVATATARIGTATVTINGIAKGAGMIAPDMATMLSFVFTDAAIAAPALQGDAQRGRGRHLQRGDDRRRHLHLRHADDLRHRQDRPARGARRRSQAQSLQDRAASRARQPLRADRARRRRRAQAGRDHGRGRGVEEIGAAPSRSPSPIRRW